MDIVVALLKKEKVYFFFCGFGVRITGLKVMLPLSLRHHLGTKRQLLRHSLLNNHKNGRINALY